jgi:phosphatidylserine/phosphatidylglycerophosphate/cardiolipin synthase-like enzyme
LVTDDTRIDLVVDYDHYTRVTRGLVEGARVELWIATANVKSVFVEAPVGTRARARGRYVSLVETLAALARRGVDVRILHASTPSGPFRAELARQASAGIAMRQCPRVHMKMIARDGAELYLGSANLTGAGLGAKGDKRRNFELGVVTSSARLLEAAQARFDAIWRGRECASCAMRRECPKPIDTFTSLGTKPRASRSPAAPSPPSSRRRRA